MTTKGGENLLYEKESYIIRGACFDLYKKFGGVFKEAIINKALVSELKCKGLNIENQKRIDIMHRGEKVGTYIPDIIIEGKILIELKVKPFIMKEDDKQFWYYLKAADYKLGFLINFCSKKLEIKRRIYDKARGASLRKSAFISALICFYFVVMGLMIGIKVHAQSSASGINLSVAPQSFELKVQKGEVIKDKIKIYNRGASPVALEAVVDDFGAAEESGTINFGNIPESQKTGENIEDVSQWIKVDKPNFILDVGEQENIDFTISVPKNVSDGGKYAVIFFEPRMSAAGSDKSSVKVLPKVGVLFLLSVGDVVPGKAGDLMSVAEFNIPGNFHLKKLENIILGATGLFQSASAEEKNNFSIVENGEMSFNLRLKNNDIYHIKPGGKLTIVSSGGKTLGETEISQTTILPGKTRQIPVNFMPDEAGWMQKYLPAAVSGFIYRNLIWGKYEAKLFLNVSGGVIEKNIEFWIFPWKTAVMLFILIIAILLFRKRIMLAGRVLFSLKLKNQNEK